MPKNYLKIKAISIAAFALGLSLLMTWFGYTIVKKTIHVDSLWNEFGNESISASYALNRIYNNFGYGGFIHNFKNFILRTDVSRIPLIEDNLLATYTALNEYRSLDISDQEKLALMVLKNTVDEYARKFQQAKQLMDAGLPSDEIDTLVYVDDQPARQAIDYLGGMAIQRSRYQELDTGSALQDTLGFLSWAWLLLPLILLTAGITIVFLKKITDASIIAERARDRVEQLICNVPDAILIISADGRIVQSNTQALKLFAYSDSEICAKNIYTLVQQQKIIQPQCEIQSLFNPLPSLGSFNKIEELTAITKYNKHIPVEVSVSHFGVNGERQAIATIRNITNRKIAENAILNAKKQTEQFLEVSEAIIVKLNRKGQITLINQRGSRVLGYEQDELIDRNWFDIAIPPEYKRDIKRIFKQLLNGQNQSVDCFENEVVTKEGRRLVIEWHNTILRDSLGVIVGTLSSGQDVTARKLVENQLRDSKERFQNLVEASSDWIWQVDNKGIYTYVSPQVRELLGYEPEEVTGKSPFDFMPEHEAINVKKSIRETVKQRKAINCLEITFLHKAGHRVVLESSGVPYFSAQKELLGYRGIDRDISDRKSVEDQLRQAATVFECTNDGIIISGKNKNIITVNHAFTEITGYELGDVVGRKPNIHKSGRHDDGFYKNLWEKIDQTGRWRGEIWNRRKNGEVYPAWENISVVKDKQGQTTHYVSVFSDISAIKQSEQRLSHLAHHDALTGLPNRLLFMANLEHALQHAKRYKRKVGLLFLDLDRFKIINDTFGHACGDSLLHEVADRLKGCVRGEDTVARLGGDEFTVILAEVAHAKDAETLAAKIVEKIAMPYLVEDQEIITSTSVGISIFPDHAENSEKLIKSADAAMYYAKEKGRDTFQFYTEELSNRAFEDMSLEQGLRQALKNQEFVLHYQPQVSLASGQIVGVEALIRWQKPNQELIPPSKFLSAAEEAGLIVPIGEWVLRTACEQAVSWQASGAAPLRISVNISGRQILREQNLNQLSNFLDELCSQPGRELVDLEITEGVLQGAANYLEVFEHFKSLGVMLAIDGFGTGYSSLSRLKQLPIDTVKIDKSFVHDIPGNADDEAITTAIISMAHNLNIKVIGEGVETRSQLDFLRNHGCDEIQGYYISEPVAADQIQKLLIQQNTFQPAVRM